MIFITAGPYNSVLVLGSADFAILVRASCDFGSESEFRLRMKGGALINSHRDIDDATDGDLDQHGNDKMLPVQEHTVQCQSCSHSMRKEPSFPLSPVQPYAHSSRASVLLGQIKEAVARDRRIYIARERGVITNGQC